MWRIVFTLAVASAALYLAVQESPRIRQWFGELDPDTRVSMLNESLKANVDRRLAQFEADILLPLGERQAAEIAALKAEITRLEGQLASLATARTPAPAAVTPKSSTPVVAAVQQQVTPAVVPAHDEPAAADTTQVAYMSDDERRKALQQLSQKMALKSVQSGY